MPYIGTQPTKVVSRQSANVYRYEATAGQTAFTGADLDNNVLACNPADMIVHMNGLRLESTDYTATSTTVTLTTAATAGDEVTVTSFVTFEVADTYTKTAADTRYVNTTGDTMTGALALPTGGFTVGTDQLAVDSAGRVTMPYQPAFRAYYNNTGFTPAAGDVFPFNSTVYNVGNHFNTSTYKFTAPIAGIYCFNFYTIHTNNKNNGAIKIYVNDSRILGGDVHYTHSAGSYWDYVAWNGDLKLAINDVVHVECYDPSRFHGNNWSHFCGRLIG